MADSSSNDNERTNNRRAQRLARHAYHKFLKVRAPAEDEEGACSCWILVDDRETGMDVTYHLVREYTMDYSEIEDPQVEVPHDTLPTRPAQNPQNQRDVWVMSQPDHIATAEVTMQRAAARGKQQRLEKDQKELAEALGVPDVAQKYLIDAHDQEDDNQLEGKVGMMLIDQEWPMWDEIGEFIGPNTSIHYTDRCEDQHVPQSFNPTGRRYDPDNN